MEGGRGQKKNFIKSFLVISGNFFVSGYTNVSKNPRNNPKKLEFFKILKKWKVGIYLEKNFNTLSYDRESLVTSLLVFF